MKLKEILNLNLDDIKNVFSKKQKEGPHESDKWHFSIKKQETKKLPEFKSKEKVELKYALLLPYAYAHIFWDDVQGELIYKVEEPGLDQSEKETLNLLEQGVKEFINISFINVKEKGTLIDYLERNIKVLLREFGIKLEENSYLKIMYYIYRDFVGLNKIEPLINDYYIEDIECNGVKTPLYIVHRRFGNIRTNIVYEEFDDLKDYVEKLAQKAGRYISYATPLLDGRLPNGDRVNATYTEDVSSKGPTFTIRKYTREPWSPIRLMKSGTVSAELLSYLWLIMENGMNILVVGGTGSGKTTLLNILAAFIPPQDRIVSIEDTRELQLEHDNWLPSVARAGAAGQGSKGEISLFDLLRESFRQRPDYVIVGEVRGKEASVLFQGMASGHSSLSTIHANDINSVIRRLQTPPINLSPSLVETLDAACLMTFAKIGDKGTRKLKAVQEIINITQDGKVSFNTPFTWDPRSNKFMFKRESVVFNKIVEKKGITRENLDKEFILRSRLFLALYQQDITDFKEVQKIIADYYKNPEKVLKRYGIL